MMKQRKTHTKSRRGCLQCKKRHVKCDEQGPPCANCVVRKSRCTYNGSPPGSQPALPTDDSRSSSGVGSGALLTPEDACGSLSSTSLRSLGQQSPHPQSPTGSSVSASVSVSEPHPLSETRKGLELELMHRWSTTTYLGTCSLPEDHHLMQTVVPLEGLKHPFLLHAIFAITALDLAANVAPDPTESRQYVHAAMEYYDTASSLLRAKLSDAQPDEFWMIFLASTLAAMYHCAMPILSRDQERNGSQDRDAADQQQQQPHTALGHVALLFGLWAGAAELGMSHAVSLYNSPITSLQHIGVPDHSILDAETRAVLDRLRTVNDALHDASDPSEVARPDQPLGPMIDPEPHTAHEAHRRAIYHLGSCFAEDARGAIQSYCSSYPGWVGHVFARLVADRDPMALLVLMHWGVLLDRLGKTMWWASSIGRTLVAELSDMLVNSRLVFLPAVTESIAWTRQQVGLHHHMIGFQHEPVVQQQQLPQQNHHHRQSVHSMPGAPPHLIADPSIENAIPLW